MAKNLKIYFFFILFIFIQKSVNGTAICVGLECAQISNETLLLANLVDPVLRQIYTKDFLNSMAESAVLQNINGTMVGGTLIEKNRISAGYSMSRSNIKPRDFYFEITELRELPTQGLAASPSFSYAFNLGHMFSKAGEWQKWNFFVQFFPYQLSETNIPFLKIRNTNVGGQVTNASFNLRYFPFKEDSSKDGFSFGLGLLHTNQNISLDAYDRRPTGFQLDGDRRRWLGINDLKYDSRINSVTIDGRYALPLSNLTLYAGLGGMYNHGYTQVQVERIALISSSINRDDFSSNPSAVDIRLSSKINVRDSNFYGILGLSYKWDQVGISFEYLKNKNTESANLGIHYYY
ncbi:MAG: hypothetical protein O9264_10360 [Leptospira sp.]|nr:hypothetical protein [Leptospira sp.]